MGRPEIFGFAVAVAAQEWVAAFATSKLLELQGCVEIALETFALSEATEASGVKKVGGNIGKKPTQCLAWRTKSGLLGSHQCKGIARVAL